MGAEDEARLQDIRQTRLQRLRLLEKQAALMGTTTDPSILIEIDQTKKELGFTETLITSPIEPKFAAEIGRDGQFVILIHMIEQMGKMLTERIDRVEEHSETRYVTVDAARAVGQQRIKLVLFAVFILMAALTWLILTRG